MEGLTGTAALCPKGFLVPAGLDSAFGVVPHSSTLTSSCVPCRLVACNLHCGLLGIAGVRHCCNNSVVVSSGGGNIMLWGVLLHITQNAH